MPSEPSEKLDDHRNFVFQLPFARIRLPAALSVAVGNVAVQKDSVHSARLTPLHRHLDGLTIVKRDMKVVQRERAAWLDQKRLEVLDVDDAVGHLGERVRLLSVCYLDR